MIQDHNLEHVTGDKTQLLSYKVDRSGTEGRIMMFIYYMCMAQDQG